MKKYQQDKGPITLSITVLSVLVLVAFYIKFMVAQYTELFYEAQFLHIPFIQDLVTGKYHFAYLFTTYGEHLFPGYNLLLLVNYKLFNISSRFELIVSFITLCLIATVLSGVLIQQTKKYWGAIVLFFIMFSPVQNIMWGMALASQVSTLLLVLILYTVYFNQNRLQACLLLAVLAPLYIIFFAGAYCAGFATTLLFIYLFLDQKQDRVVWWTLLGVSLVAYSSYYLLLHTYGVSLNVVHYRYNAELIAQFIDLMFGSSLLGKAYFEKYHAFFLYYVAGFFVLMLLLGCVWNFLSQPKSSRADKFFIALGVYAVTNVLIVAIARNTNGMEGALGQWYQAHLRFIPAVIAYFLLSRIPSSRVYNCVRQLAFLGLIALLFLGYFHEYIKGFYVREWKNNLKAVIANHLISPELYEGSSGYDSLLWEWQLVNPGLKLLYLNKLSYFRNNKIFYSTNVTPDGWIEKTADKDFYAICPVVANNISVTFDHLSQHNANLMAKQFKLVHDEGGYQLHAVLSGEIKYIRINVAKFIVYPMQNNKDLRKLLFHISAIECH